MYYSENQHCKSYREILDLGLKNVFFICANQFKDLKGTACLNLSSDSPGEAFNDIELIFTLNLQYLCISKQIGFHQIFFI